MQFRSAASAPLTPRPILTRCLAFALVVPFLPGQSRQDLVPPGAPEAEGNGSRYLEGLGTEGRSQVLLDASLLASLVGRELTGLAFRRDGATTRAWHGGAVDLVVRIGAARRPVAAPGPSFESNLAAPTEVFRGSVTLPATLPTTRPIDWAPSEVLALEFQSPYRYLGGDLAVELEGSPVLGEPFGWPVDAVVETLRGEARRFGQASGGYRHADGNRASVAVDSLVAGLHADFECSGEPGATALLLLAPTPRSQPLDLSPFGAPGSVLRVDPVVVLPATVSAPWAGPQHGGVARHRFRLPATPQVFDAAFAVQWLEWAPAGVSCSEAFLCRVANRLPALGMALCTERAGGAFTIETQRAPRLRFTSR